MSVEKVMERLSQIASNDYDTKRHIQWMLSQVPEELEFLLETIKETKASERTEIMHNLHQELDVEEDLQYITSAMKNYVTMMGKVKVNRGHDDIGVEVLGDKLTVLRSAPGDNYQRSIVKARYQIYIKDQLILSHFSEITLSIQRSCNPSRMFQSLVQSILLSVSNLNLFTQWDLEMKLANDKWNVDNDVFIGVKKVADYQWKDASNVCTSFVKNLVAAIKDRVPVGASVPTAMIETLRVVDNLFPNTLYEEPEGLVIRPIGSVFTDIIIFKLYDGVWKRSNSQNKVYKRFTLADKMNI